MVLTGSKAELKAGAAVLSAARMEFGLSHTLDEAQVAEYLLARLGYVCTEGDKRNGPALTADPEAAAVTAAHLRHGDGVDDEGDWEEEAGEEGAAAAEVSPCIICRLCQMVLNIYRMHAVQGTRRAGAICAIKALELPKRPAAQTNSTIKE